MALTLNRVEIFLFDVHLSLQPLLAPALLRREVSWLLDRDRYNELQRTGEPFEIEGFGIRPLRRSLKRNHFWKQYKLIWPPQLASATAAREWDLQVPMRCTPSDLKLDLKLETGLSNLKHGVRSRVFLFPSGWSCNLELRLAGELGLQEVRSLVSTLLHGSRFLLEGREARLTEVFRTVGSQLQKALYEGSVADYLPLHRFVVVGLSSREPVLPYFADRGKSGALSEAERARFHGALLGREVTVQELQRPAGESKGFLWTRFRHGDFALTYFEHGVLASAANAVTTGSKSGESTWCLFSNIRSCAMVTHALLALLRQAPRLKGRSSQVADDLCHAASFVLGELPNVYHNPFCRGLFLNHKALKGFVTAPEADPGAP